MKVLLAGATGVLGVPLTRQLVAHGHEVFGLTRDRASAPLLVSLGATPVVADALDRDGLLRALDTVEVDAVVNELTALKKPPRRHSDMALTDRLRVEGTANLVAAADKLGAPRFVTQSFFLGYGYRDHGSTMVDESAPFGVAAGDATGDATGPHVAAMRATEEQAFAMPEGIALRYGLLYGGDASSMRAMLARRAVPVARGGLLAWVHHDDAAAATVAALERGRAGNAYNIVDELPATWDDVVKAMADALGTRPPHRIPPWVFRLLAPYPATFVVDSSIRICNAKAERELGWQPMYATYHEGVAAMAAGLASGPDGRLS
jgi:nucleoside-diphosphate-sugar epimerase